MTKYEGFHFISIIDDGDESATMFDVNLCGNKRHRADHAR
jgi:hypothetical protein